MTAMHRCESRRTNKPQTNARRHPSELQTEEEEVVGVVGGGVLHPSTKNNKRKKTDRVWQKSIFRTPVMHIFIGSSFYEGFKGIHRKELSGKVAVF